MTSRGIYGRKPLDIEVRVREIVSPGPGQAIVKVRACGVRVALSLLRQARIDSAAIVTHTFGFPSVKDTLVGMVDGSLPAVKAVLVF